MDVGVGIGGSAGCWRYPLLDSLTKKWVSKLLCKHTHMSRLKSSMYLTFDRPELLL